MILVTFARIKYCSRIPHSAGLWMQSDGLQMSMKSTTACRRSYATFSVICFGLKSGQCSAWSFFPPHKHEVIVRDVYICCVANMSLFCCCLFGRSASISVKSVVTCWRSRLGRLIDSTVWEWCLEMVCVHRFGMNSKNGLALNELENSMVLQKAMLTSVSG